MGRVVALTERLTASIRIRASIAGDSSSSSSVFLWLSEDPVRAAIKRVALPPRDVPSVLRSYGSRVSRMLLPATPTLVFCEVDNPTPRLSRWNAGEQGGHRPSFPRLLASSFLRSYVDSYRRPITPAPSPRFFYLPSHRRRQGRKGRPHDDGMFRKRATVPPSSSTSMRRRVSSKACGGGSWRMYHFVVKLPFLSLLLGGPASCADRIKTRAGLAAATRARSGKPSIVSNT